MHGPRDNAVARHGGLGHHRTIAPKPPRPVRRDTARYDQTSPALCSPGEKSCLSLVTVGRLFEPRVHGTHQRPIGQGQEAQVQRRQEVRIVRRAQYLAMNVVLAAAITTRPSPVSPWTMASPSPLRHILVMIVSP